jgi:hypothetical protein
MTTRADDRPTTTTTAAPAGRARRWTTAVPRSRGFLSGLLLVILGVWGGLIPFVGPYFGYEFGSDQAWVMSWNRFWLDVLPAAVLVLSGLMLMGSANRVSGILGGWLGVCAGAWYVVGPTVATLWDGTNPIGAPIGSDFVQVIELLGYFYALGAVAIAVSAMALGRMSIVGVRDVEIVEQRRSGEPAPATPPPGNGAAADEPPPRRRRLFGRSR